MSFLNAVLGSIGTGTSIPNPTSASKVTNVPAKRKAEDELRPPSDKSLKIERNNVRLAERTAKPLPSPSQNVSTPSAVSAASAASSASSSKNPKKGSFAAIMARAKEAQATSTVGSITHKPKEKVKTRKELVMEREAAKKAAKKGVPFTGLKGNKDNPNKDPLKKPVLERSDSTTKKSTNPAPIKEKSGYQGTMQPSNASRYTGTARPQAVTTKSTTNIRESALSKPNRASDKRRRHQEESDEEESEDGYDYASEDFSDMDAGFDDMENEEEQAARIARKEDADAQAELDRLKREKDRKKMQLAKGKR